MASIRLQLKSRLPKLWPEIRAVRHLRHRVVALWWLRRRLSQTSEPLRLNVGCGQAALPGWVNIDANRFSGVDLVADVRGGIPFRGVSAIYAEHFLEHLTILEAIDFLLEAHRVLRDGGAIRISTPNLEWILRTHYDFFCDPERRIANALKLNLAFFGWSHRFAWNRELLDRSLVACGFSRIRWCRYGQSCDPALQNLEQHQPDDDTPDCPHVLIVEATKGPSQPAELDRLRERILADFDVHVHAES